MTDVTARPWWRWMEGMRTACGLRVYSAKPPLPLGIREGDQRARPECGALPHDAVPDITDPDTSELRALDHLHERLAMHRGVLAAIRAILDRTGDYDGTLPDRVQKLVNDWQTGGRALIRISALVMAGENESAADAVDRYVGTTRQQFAGWVKVTEGIDAVLTAAGYEPLPDYSLAQRASDLARGRDRYRDELAHVREMLDGAGIAGDIPAAVEMLLKERAEWRARMPAAPSRVGYVDTPSYLRVRDERDRLRAELDAIRAPAAPDVAPAGVGWSGYGLSINGDYFGEYCEAREGGWWVFVNGVGTGPLPNEATARAVLLALAGQECGRVVFGLREDAPVGALIAAVIAGLGSFVTDLVAGGTTWTKDPATVRAWVAHGQAALTIEAVSGV